MRKVLFILSELDDSDLDWLVRNGIRETHPAGRVLIHEGVAIDVLYVVLDGSLSVTLGAEGRQVAVLRSGEVVGELSFLDSRPASATVTAREEVSVLAVARSRLSAKLSEDPWFAARFYRALGVFLSSRLRRTQLRLSSGDSVGGAETSHPDELDPELLDGVAIAGARFDWMLRKLRGAASGED